MISNIWTLLLTALGTLVAYIVYYITVQVITARHHVRLGKEAHCMPAPQWPVKSFWPFGIGFILTLYKHIKNHTLLEHRVQVMKQHGNTLGFRVLGITGVVTIEPENLKSVMSLNFRNWSVGEDRRKSMVPFLGYGIFTTDGEEWQHSRDMLRPCFNRTQIGDGDVYEWHVARLIQAIPRDGSTVDLQDLFFRLSLDIATDFLFGTGTDCLNPDGEDAATQEFVKAFSYCENPLESKDRYGLIRMFLPTSKFKQQCKIVQEYAELLMKKSLPDGLEKPPPAAATSSGRYVFLHELASQTSDPIKIRSELLNILLAGRDTTASLLTDVWFELSRRPQIWHRLRDEAASLAGQQPTFAHLKNMKYLRAVLNESLRLHPVVPENSRQAVCDTVLPVGGGPDGTRPVFVPRDHYVVWSTYAMHRRKDLYGADADEFRPERWLDDGDSKGLRVGWEYLPFNGGPRICIGQQFALMEASYVTVRLMQEFPHIESRDATPWQERLALTLTNLNGCKVALTPGDRAA